MEQTLLVHEEDISVNGLDCHITIYHQGETKYFAITRFSDNDAFICDGFSMEAVLAKHRGTIPLAISCRPSLRKEEMKYALAA